MQAVQQDEERVGMDKCLHDFKIGDRVHAPQRTGFPEGTVVRILDDRFLLIHWVGDLLETICYTDIVRSDGSGK